MRVLHYIKTLIWKLLGKQNDAIIHCFQYCVSSAIDPIKPPE
jgi:hypothetical protein